MMNIGAQLRDNPLSLLLIGAGVGLMITRNMTNGYQGGMGLYRDDSKGDMMRRLSDPTAGYGSHEDERRGSRDVLSRAQEAVSSQAENIRDTMMETYSSASESVTEMGERAAQMTQRATSGLATLASEQPLVLGALGLLAGAALAAMLPRTQIEDEYVRPAARQLRDQASSMANETLQRAKGAAGKVANVLSSEFSNETDKASSGASGGPTPSGMVPDKPEPGSARPTENISAGHGASGSRS